MHEDPIRRRFIKTLFLPKLKKTVEMAPQQFNLNQRSLFDFLNQVYKPATLKELEDDLKLTPKEVQELKKL